MKTRKLRRRDFYIYQSKRSMTKNKSFRKGVEKCRTLCKENGLREVHLKNIAGCMALEVDESGKLIPKFHILGYPQGRTDIPLNP